MDFAWDSEKAVANKQKHGIDFPFAAHVFYDPGRFERRDNAHSTGEQRWVTIGRVETMILYVVHTDRGKDTIRIISARKATKYEEKSYRQFHSRSR